MRYLAQIGISLMIAAALTAAPSSLMAAGDTDKADKTTTMDKAKEKSGEAKTSIKDSWLTSKTKIALFADDRVKGRQIGVETKKGEVFLRGKVDSAEAKAAAEEIAKGVEGVKSVKNELQVVAPSKREAVKANDEDITKQVKAHVAKDSRLKDANISVETHAGVVTLKGEVPNLTTSARASETVWRVRGVRSVKNDLTLKNEK